MVLVPNPGGFVSTSHENGMSPPTGLKPAPMTGIYPFRGGTGRADTRRHAHLFHVGTGRTAAQSQATRRQPAVSVADLLRRDRCDRFAPQVVWGADLDLDGAGPLCWTGLMLPARPGYG